MKHKSQNNKKSQASKNGQATQLQQANALLVELSKNVTAEDRKAVISEGILSEPPLIRYLKGNGSDLDTAMNLIRFIRGRIADRDRELAGEEIDSKTIV